MLDAFVRTWIDRPLSWTGRQIARAGIGADEVTLAGFATGLTACAAVLLNEPLVALALLLAGRLLDGLDGAVARATAPSDRGGFLDIVLDFVFYGAFPLAFALLDPWRNALPAAVLIASFYANGSAFLAYAIMAQKRGLKTEAQGAKSLYYLSGLAEGTETIAVFAAFCLFPQAFPVIAVLFAAVCLVSAGARIVIGWRSLG